MLGLSERTTAAAATFNIVSPEELANIDFSDKSSHASSVWSVNITFIVLVGIIVSMRVFTRAQMTGRFFADDVLAVFATLFIIISASCALVATRFGLGQHVWNLPPPLTLIEETVKKCVQVRHIPHCAVLAGADTASSCLCRTSFTPPRPP